MTATKLAKYHEIVDEFDAYLMQHLEIAEQFPDDCILAVISKDDRQLTEGSIAMARYRSDGRQVVTVQKSGSTWKLQQLDPA